MAAAAAFADALISLAALRSATSLISFSSIFLRSSRNSLNSAGSFKEKFKSERKKIFLQVANNYSNQNGQLLFQIYDMLLIYLYTFLP